MIRLTMILLTLGVSIATATTAIAQDGFFGNLDTVSASIRVKPPAANCSQPMAPWARKAPSRKALQSSRAMRRRRIARFATLNSHHRRGDEEDTRNAKATDAIQVEQTFTARWGAGPNDYIRFRAGFAY
jgi:hypothetical protein